MAFRRPVQSYSQHELAPTTADDGPSSTTAAQSPSSQRSMIGVDTIYPRWAAPQFGVMNDFVLNGYRPAMTLSHCLRSTFAWHNETLNIWTHLLGLFVFVMQMARLNFVVIPQLQDPNAMKTTTSNSAAPPSMHPVPMDSTAPIGSGMPIDFPAPLGAAVPIIWNTSLICFGACMAFSAGFHTFSCHSLETSTRWLRMDFTGITCATMGCYLPGCYVAFYCHPFWRDAYLTAVGSLLVAILALPLFLRRYWSPDWVWIRAAIQIVAVAVGVMPIGHCIALEGGWSSPFSSAFLPRVAALYFLGCFSFFFYLTKFPERLRPGYFDFCGQSHQIWHLCIFFTLYHWHHCTLELLQHRLRHSCFG